MMEQIALSRRPGSSSEVREMLKESVLVVEDDENIRELVKLNLENEGFAVQAVGTGEECLTAARHNPPSLILLDLMLPGIDGLDACRILKNDSRTRNIPVLILTARSEEADIVTGLEIGADDYVTKPFSPRVLIARLRKVLRKSARPLSKDSDVLKVHDLVINPRRHEVVADRNRVSLTPTEFKILYLMARRPGWVFTRNQIIDGTRDVDVVVTERSVDVQVASLRRKLGMSGLCIETVRGVGYRVKE